MLVRLSGKMVSGRLPNGLTDQYAIWARPRVGRRNRVLNGGPDPPREAGARPEYHVWGGGLEPRVWRAPEREPIMGVWCGAPSGVQGHSPPEAENLLASGCATEAANLPHSVRTLSLSK